MVKVLQLVRDSGGPQAKEAGRMLKKMQGPKAQWSAMVKAATRDAGRARLVGHS